MAAAVGDIAGSAYEGRTHRTKDYNAVKMFSSRAHFTDDTVAHLCLCRSLSEEQEHGRQPLDVRQPTPTRRLRPPIQTVD